MDNAVVNTREKTFNTIFVQGRKVAIDASMSIYQFLIAVRQEGNMLTNADGETTRWRQNTHMVSRVIWQLCAIWTVLNFAVVTVYLCSAWHQSGHSTFVWNVL